MNERQILEELKKIENVLNMNKEEFVKNYPDNAEYVDATGGSFYACKCGIASAMSQHLIERIEKNELR